MKGFPVRPVPVDAVSEAAKAVARRQAEQLTLVRRRAQPTAVYITRLTVTAVAAYLLALQLPGASSRSVIAPLTALLVVQATLFHTIRSAIQRVVGVTAGVLAAVAVSAYVPFSWYVLGLLIAGAVRSRHPSRFARVSGRCRFPGPRESPPPHGRCLLR